MGKKNLPVWINPFQKIAGAKALIIGVLGLAISTILSMLSGYHYHGLLLFGPAFNQAWWCYAAERLIVWFVPAVLFCIGAHAFRSHFRLIDLFGTTAFAFLPMIFMNLCYCIPAMKAMENIDLNQTQAELEAQLMTPIILLAIVISLLFLFFFSYALFWLFQALCVSCNLKGWRIAVVYIVGVFVGDALCRILISNLLY